VIEVEQADVVVFACINGVLFELSRACLGKCTSLHQGVQTSGGKAVLLPVAIAEKVWL
jgi:hypothetical protein